METTNKNNELIADMINTELNKTSLIIWKFLAGHKGLVGSAILRKLKEKKYKNIIIADKKLNLRPKKSIWILKKKKPDLVIIAAAK